MFSHHKQRAHSNTFGADMVRRRQNASLGIQYLGQPGSSRDCVEAVEFVLQFGYGVVNARILTHGNSHALFLITKTGDRIVISSGFGSGYLGEGSKSFSYVLSLLDAHGAEVDEYDISHGFLARVEDAKLSAKDLEWLEAARPVRPSRWYEYVFDKHDEQQSNGLLWASFPVVIPFGLLDRRLIDLAITFWEGPDDRLLIGYRRLEDLVRKRTGISEHGSKLFAAVFQGKTAKLSWPDIDPAEQIGRANMFTATYMAYRNPRAHRELKHERQEYAMELLLLNNLYLLERSAREVANANGSNAAAATAHTS